MRRYRGDLFELQEVVEGLHAALVLRSHGVPLDQELYIYIKIYIYIYI